MYRHTFPETILTNRFVHDERPNWRDELNYAFVEGLRFDVSIYRGRRIGIAGLPAYASWIKHLNEVKDRYPAYFFGGRFIVDHVPVCEGKLYYAEFDADGGRLMTFMNYGDEIAVAHICGKEITVNPHDVACVEL